MNEENTGRSPSGEDALQSFDLLEELTGALGRLDRLLAAAVLLAQSEYGPSAAEDPYRGLYVRAEEVARLLERQPGEPILHPRATDTEEQGAGETPAPPKRFAWLGRWFGSGEVAGAPGEEPPGAPATEAYAAPPGPELPLDVPEPQVALTLPLSGTVGPLSPLGWLRETYGLTSFDLDLLIVALAPELDLRYERLYGYLQDDVTRRRPSVDLALNLLCATAAEKASRRGHFAADAPLVRNQLVHLTGGREDDATSPLLATFYQVDGQIVRLLLGQRQLDPRLSGCCRLFEPSGATVPAHLSREDADVLAALVVDAWDSERPLRLYFYGAAGVGKRRTARAVASGLESPLLVVDLWQALSVDRDLEWLPEIIFREALLHDALLYVEDIDVLREQEYQIGGRRFWGRLVEDVGVTILSGENPRLPARLPAAGIVRVGFSPPDFDERRALWDAVLNSTGRPSEAGELDALADRFRLTLTQIEDAAETASVRARWRAGPTALKGGAEVAAAETKGGPTLDDLFAAAREQSGHQLADLAIKIEPKCGMGDIVLPEDSLSQLTEICARVAYRRLVLEEWDFLSKLSQGTGIMALFAGPSGTGKTMAADIIARELGLDLYKIDLSGVVSKYIGETEKNLERIFRAAENANAILFFDEADALFGKRSEVRDSHDRYANIEISYLLQKMESYDGIAILATNLRQNLDDSFVRRMTFSVQFPFPDVQSRGQIWQGIWPRGMRLADDVDLAFLAERFRLAGGNIKNIALAAAFLVAETGGPVTMQALLRATRREYQKMGKTMSEAELKGRTDEALATPAGSA